MSAFCSEEDNDDETEVLSSASFESSGEFLLEVTDDELSDNDNDGLIYGPYDLNIDSVSDYAVSDSSSVSDSVSSDSESTEEGSSLEEAITALTESVDQLNDTMTTEEEPAEEETTEEEPAEEETTEEEPAEYDPDAAFLELGQALLEEQERIVYTLWIIAGLIIGLALGGVICFILL